MKELTNAQRYYDEKGNALNVLSSAVSYTTTSGDQAVPVIAGVVGKKVRVLSFAISSSINGATVFLRNGAGGTQLSETILRTISGSYAGVNYQRSAYYPIYLFETTIGTSLVLNASAAGIVSVQVVYVLI
jgi:hypothetical protein